MLISCKEIQAIWGVNPNGVLHIGAHEAEEARDYKKQNWGRTIWVEAQSNLVDKLKSNLDPIENKVIHAAVWDIDGIELELKVTNNSQSTSLLELGTHNLDYPEIFVTRIEKIKTSRVDNLIDKSEKFEFVNLDIQGAELNALRGMGPLLEQVKYIYTEVNKKQVYVDCAMIGQIEDFLTEQGFRKVCVRWVPWKGWGDALFIRNGEINNGLLPRTRAIFYQVRFYSIYYFHEFGHKVRVLFFRKQEK
jgi:FkbM family methyltransferase